jgi:two-component system sensor kinase FixL
LLERIGSEIERAGDVVERMGSFPDLPAAAAGRQRVDLGPMIDEAIALTSMGTRPKIPVNFAKASDLPPVTGDPVQIRQLLLSLLRCAVHAVRGQTDACVQVAAVLEPGRIVLRVADGGAGVPTARGPHPSPASIQPGDGGLALAISSIIAQNHGGSLTVDPEGQERRACFTLHLPLPDAHA